MMRLQVPSVACVIGEGGSGGAVAIAVADRVLMQENAIYSVISPEGCAAILWRDASEAKKAAAAFKPDARHCLDLGVIDGIVPRARGRRASGLRRGRRSSSADGLEAALDEIAELDPDERRMRPPPALPHDGRVRRLEGSGRKRRGFPHHPQAFPQPDGLVHRLDTEKAGIGGFSAPGPCAKPAP